MASKIVLNGTLIQGIANMGKISGVYKITNTITGDFYIGSSKNIKQRWSVHKSPSRWKSVSGMLLYQAFLAYLDLFYLKQLALKRKRR